MFCIKFKLDNVKNGEESQIFPACKVKCQPVTVLLMVAEDMRCPSHRQRTSLLMHIRQHELHVCTVWVFFSLYSQHSNVEESKWMLLTEGIVSQLRNYELGKPYLYCLKGKHYLYCPGPAPQNPPPAPERYYLYLPKLFTIYTSLKSQHRTKAVNASAHKTCRNMRPTANYLQQIAHVLHKILITTD